MSNVNKDGADPEFAKIPKDQTGFYIWRIEKMALAPVPTIFYGDFYTGDAYIVYSATNQGEQGGQLLKPKKFERTADYRIHFWLGENCSVDERTLAAYKTVELDSYFQDAPVQHREVQGFESTRFVSYFPKGIRYLKGGVATGLKLAEDGFRPKLFIVKGSKTPVARELPEISWRCMNDGDAFVLDAGERIFIYTGKHANKKEVFEATTIAQLFKDQPGESIVRVDDGREVDQLIGQNLELFEKFLPLAQKKLKPHTEADPDDKWNHETADKLTRLFKCSDASGKIEIRPLKEGLAPERSDLNSNDCFIIDAGRGKGGIWTWVGKKSTDQERTESTKYMTEYFKQQKYSEHTPAARIVDGGEPFEFKALFSGWR
ncbi:Adseverin [Hypsibius exemplaris]|uniref:Adseverin n=1 Tax=Hypsibius exemplaris TaxID=2072580 RepID=A0A1W0XFM3_HYPEX|nr:Adseverin [Hypsibius exemplaris]